MFILFDFLTVYRNINVQFSIYTALVHISGQSNWFLRTFIQIRFGGRRITVWRRLNHLIFKHSLTIWRMYKSGFFLNGLYFVVISLRWWCWCVTYWILWAREQFQMLLLIHVSPFSRLWDRLHLFFGFQSIIRSSASIIAIYALNMKSSRLAY